MKTRLFPENEIRHENPETGETTILKTPDECHDTVDAMRRLAGKFDAAGFVTDMQVELGFVECHIIETKNGHLFSCNYYEPDLPYFYDSGLR